MLRQPYSGVTYSPRATRRAASQRSGAEPTANAVATRHATAIARVQAAAAARFTPIDRRQVRAIAAATKIHAIVSTFCGVRTETSADPTDMVRPPVATIATAAH